MFQIAISVLVGAAFWYGAKYGPGIEWVLAVLAFGLTYQTMQNERTLKDIRKTLKEHALKLFPQHNDADD